MDIARRERADRLAAEYVLGTLGGPARRRFEALLPAHPLLRDAVAQWRDRLEVLAMRVAPVAPPERVWRGIEQRLFGPGDAAPGAARSSERASWWHRVAVWRALAGSAVLGLAAVLVLRPPAPPPAADGAPLLVVLAPNPQAGSAVAAVPAGFVATVSADGRSLVLKPLAPVTLTAGRALELWAVPAQGAPRSLGLVRADGPTVLVPAVSPRQASAWAVSIEPVGGSPSGAPTGPIVSLGKLDA